MSRPAPPALTVRHDGSARTFAAGSDVVIGRDLRADVRIAHPLISRAHLVLRFDQGRWLAIDNGSLNGMYVNGRRVPTVDIHDGLHLNIGNPDGPELTFEVGRQQPSAGRRRRRSPSRAVPAAPGRASSRRRAHRPRHARRPTRPVRSRVTRPASSRVTRVDRSPATPVRRLSPPACRPRWANRSPSPECLRPACLRPRWNR